MAAAITAVAVTTALVVALPPAPADALPQPALDWTMAERTTLDSNGRAVYLTTPEEITPAAGFEVEFDACASTAAGSTVVEWRWRIEEGPWQVETSCTFTTSLTEGTYRVWMTAVDSAGRESLPILRHVVVQDWLIVAFGDSYGAGEGAPDGPLSPSALAGFEAAWVDFEDALNEVGRTAATVTEKLTDFRATERAFAEFEAAWAAWEADPLNPVRIGAVLDKAAVLGITSITNITDALWNAAVAAVKTAEAAWKAAVKTWEVAVAGYHLAVEVIDNHQRGLSADWQDRLCHRSGNSGAFQAAKALEDLDPRTSVTLVHLACTGATILEGIVDRYAGSESEAHLHTADKLPPQPVEATRLVAGREVDAIYVSIGGNDAQFANIVMACMIQPACYTDGHPFPTIPDTAARIRSICDPLRTLSTVLPTAKWGSCLRKLEQAVADTPELLTKSAKQIFEIGLNGGTFDGKQQLPLAARYALMDGFIFDNPHQVHLLRPDRRERLYISEYPDLTRDQSGAYCHGDAHGLDAIPGWSVTETTWADDFLTPTLNSAIQQAAEAHDWTFVSGVHAGYSNKGYCSTDRFIVRLQESLVNQAQIDGAVHPNTLGFNVYAVKLLETMLPHLYPVADPSAPLGRDLTQPRRPDQVPFAYTGGDRTVDEGSTLALTNDSWDGDGDPVRYEWILNAAPNVATLTPTNGRAKEPDLHAIDNGQAGLTITAADEDTDWFGTHPLPHDTATVTITNVAPTVGAITAPIDPVPVGQPVSVEASFTDPGVYDSPFTAAWSFGDGAAPSCTSTSPALTAPTCQVTDEDGGGHTVATHTYTTPGIYTVKLAVTDKDGGTGHAEDHQYVVVYDPDGPFVTGAGRLWSPPGAYAADPALQGEAKFGFQSRYRPGAIVPTGTTDFSFEAGDFAFRSSAYQWLVVSGSRATYKGTGTVNGQPGYGFLLAAVDGDEDDLKKHDRLRFKVWDTASGDLVYDNLAGEPIDTDIRAHDVTRITLGQIVIHDNKGKKK